MDVLTIQWGWIGGRKKTAQPIPLPPEEEVVITGAPLFVFKNTGKKRRKPKRNPEEEFIIFIDLI